MSKELIARRLLRIAFLMLLVWLVLWATSCGGKKKLTQKSQFSTEIAKVERVSELTEKATVKESLTVQKTETHSITENSDVTLTQADPDKEIILTDPQGRVTKIKGANALISIRKKTVRKKDTFGQKMSKTDLTKNVKQTETDSKEKTTAIEKNVSKEKEGKFPWWWLILIAIFYLGFSLWRKSVNPLRWF